MRALFVLTPAESKRLIGKAVSQMEAVKRAEDHDWMLISHGSTNVYVAEEILGKKEFAKLAIRDRYLSGIISRGTLCTTLGDEKPPLLMLNRGVLVAPAPTMAEMLLQFGRDSVFIKGANAIDRDGNAGVFAGHPEGGGIGWSIGTLLARGIHIITPVGLEKMIPFVHEAVTLCGQQTLDYCQGMRVGMIPLAGATVVTEIEALRILTGVESSHVASGGCSGSEGAITLIAEGETEVVEKSIQLIESIKGEPPLMPCKGICEICTPTSPAQRADYSVEGLTDHCKYKGKSEEELPAYLKNR
jgi:tRNA-binding EMAP/Myf-like protein